MNYSELLAQASAAIDVATDYVAIVHRAIFEKVVFDGRAKSELVNKEQRIVHGLSLIHI